jgi:hypothetical protein
MTTSGSLVEQSMADDADLGADHLRSPPVVLPRVVRKIVLSVVGVVGVGRSTGAVVGVPDLPLSSRATSN